jgi:hypothetical protein
MGYLSHYIGFYSMPKTCPGAYETLKQGASKDQLTKVKSPIEQKCIKLPLLPFPISTVAVGWNALRL